MRTQYLQGMQRSTCPHGVQGVECSNHSVPTNKINDLGDRLCIQTALYIIHRIISVLFLWPIRQRFYQPNLHEFNGLSVDNLALEATVSSSPRIHANHLRIE